MYTYIKSVVLDRAIGSPWVEADLSAVVVFDIYNQFSKVVHVLTHPLINNGGEIFVDFDALKVTYSGYNDTLSAWLVEINDTVLPMLDSLPSSKVEYVRYEDAIRVGYKANLAKAGFNYPDNYPNDALNDLLITRPRTNTDVSLLHRKALVTVNGYLHMTDTDGTKLWVLDAGKSLRHSKGNQLGIISFNKIGDIKKIPLKDAMLSGASGGRSLMEHIDIRLDEPIGNRSFMLSIGGYLQLPEASICWQSGDSGISLCLDRIPYVERYFESSKYLDLKALGLEVLPDSPGTINLEQLKSDEVIMRYMTLSQTFVVLVDIPNLFYRRIYLRSSNLPGMYTSYQEPVYPQITGYGKMSEYWKTHEDGYWFVNIMDGVTPNYVFSYRGFNDPEVINSNRLPGRTYQHSGGYMLEIGGYL
jgi:hypothetical protein